MFKFDYGKHYRSCWKQKQLAVLKTFMKAFKISFEESNSPYNPEFVELIQQAEKDIKDGKGVKVDIDNLWK